MRPLTSIIALILAGCASGAASHPSLPDAQGDVRPVRGTTVRYLDVQDGGGAAAERGDCVRAHYTVYRSGGQWVESSKEPGGEAAVFVLGSGRVIRGWDAGIEGMKVGGIRRLWVPEEFAYGAAGRPPLIPAHVALIFDVQLMGTSAPVNGSCAQSVR